MRSPRSPLVVMLVAIGPVGLLLAGESCLTDTYSTSIGGGGFGGALGQGGKGGSTAYVTCEACLEPKSGAIATTCATQSSDCDADPGCAALLACVKHGYPALPGQGGAGGASSSSGGGAPSSASTTTSSTSSATSSASSTSGSGGAGSAGGAVASTTTTIAAGSGGGGGAPIQHGACDSSTYLGACCVFDCATALGTPEPSLQRYLEQEVCVTCTACKNLCQVPDGYCEAIADGPASCP